MPSPRQLSFLPFPEREHGGAYRQGKRKTRRPFDPKRPLHLSLRSGRARGSWSMLRPQTKWRILDLLHRTADRYRIRVYRFANVGNHLHLLVQARKREQFQAFLREFSGAVAVLVTGAIKGRPQKFWDGLAWSKILDWGRQFKNTARYVMLNFLEGAGLRDRSVLAQLERDGMVMVRGPD